MIESSYKENNFGEVFDAIVRAFQPKTIVELGVLNGYSTFFMAKALARNGRGTLRAYDLFEDYPYKHGSFQEVSERFKDFEFCEIIKKDAFTVHEEYSAGPVDLLHVDLSNTGETVDFIMEHWDEKIVYGGIILFEGGTVDRDQVDWMTQYNKRSLKAAFENNSVIREKYIFGTYLKFPGLTMLLKKR